MFYRVLDRDRGLWRLLRVLIPGPGKGGFWEPRESQHNVCAVELEWEYTEWSQHHIQGVWSNIRNINTNQCQRQSSSFLSLRQQGNTHSFWELKARDIRVSLGKEHCHLGKPGDWLIHFDGPGSGFKGQRWGRWDHMAAGLWGKPKAEGRMMMVLVCHCPLGIAHWRYIGRKEEGKSKGSKKGESEGKKGSTKEERECRVVEREGKGIVLRGKRKEGRNEGRREGKKRRN